MGLCTLIGSQPEKRQRIPLPLLEEEKGSSTINYRLYNKAESKPSNESKQAIIFSTQAVETWSHHHKNSGEQLCRGAHPKKGELLESKTFTCDGSPSIIAPCWHWDVIVMKGKQLPAILSGKTASKQHDYAANNFQTFSPEVEIHRLAKIDMGSDGLYV